MKFSYKFSNLLGTIYRKGNVIFTPDGNSVISPVGNKITVYDLKNNGAKTLCLQSMYNYTCIAQSPNGMILVAANENGQAELISMVSQTVIHRHKFRNPCHVIKFSPDGKYFAAASSNVVFVYKSPGQLTGEYNGFVVKKYFYGGYDDITTMDWSSDSRLLLIGYKDNTCKVFSIERLHNFRHFVLGGHTDKIVGCYFEQNSYDINTISANGQLCIWECSLTPDEIPLWENREITEEPYVKKDRKTGVDDEEDDDINFNQALEKTTAQEKKEEDKAEEIEESMKDLGKETDSKKIHPFFYKRLSRHYLADEPRKENRNAYLTAAAYHNKTKLLVTGFSTGSFYIHELPDVSLIHSLSITNFGIETAVFNQSGDWIALGSQSLGQLLVWEWQSEQYIMKQQSHTSEINSIDYSPDGQFIASGGADGKLKLWNINSGFCFVTFSEHTSAITAVKFSATKNFVVSASLDGTVRAYDIMRYRNFRTFTLAQAVQFSCVALDHSGEFVAAGGQDLFEIYIWSIKLGNKQPLEILAGHESPVVALEFAPTATSTLLISGSWDKTIKIWDCIETTTDHETIDIMADVTALAIKPNGEEVAVASLSGNIQIFDVRSANQIGTIEGRKDLGSGISHDDLVTAKTNLRGKCFTTLIYSADGECILAGGMSKNVCIYNVKQAILLKKFEITQNYSLDGMAEYLSHRSLCEFGNKSLIEEREQLEGGNIAIKLPGVRKGDVTARNYKPEVKVFSVKFSPSGQSWSAATTEGLMIYSLDKGIVFDPFNLSLEVTPKVVRINLMDKKWSTALVMALKLNEGKLVQEVMEQIPTKEVDFSVASLPDKYVPLAVNFIGKFLSNAPHIEFYLTWVSSILNHHGQKDKLMTQHNLITLHQILNQKYQSLQKICDFNKYTMRVLKENGKKYVEQMETNGLEEDNLDNMDINMRNDHLLNDVDYAETDSSTD